MRKKKFIATSILAGFILSPCVSQAVMDASEPKTRELTCSAKKTIGEEIRKLDPGDTLLVYGTCNENLLITEEFHNITLDGQGSATINGPDASLSTVVIRGTGITIRGFAIAGGSNGILVSRGGTALIDGNTIDTTGNNGININQNSSARIVNNTIQNNPGDGIVINESSSARIGYRSSSDTAASLNMIQHNGDQGVTVARASNARIVGNIISNNGGNGVLVNRGSHTDLSANTFDGNGESGVLVTRNSAVNLGSDNGAGIFDAPNVTTVNNGVNGIRCRINSSADGRLGSLNGGGGAISFDGSCINSLNP